MNFARVFAVLLRQYYLIRGSLTRLIPIFFWSVIDVLIWGFMTRYLLQIVSPGFNVATAILSAVTLWAFFVRIILGVSMAMFEDGWSRNFLNLFASPISIYEYACGIVLTSIVNGVLSLLMLLVVTNLAFDLSLFAYGVLLIPFFFILLFTGIAIGLLGSSIVMRYGPSAEWLVWPLPALIAPFVGVFYPLSVLPGWMQNIAATLPPSYIFEGIRQFSATGAIAWGEFAVGLLLSLFYVALGLWAFISVYRSTLKRGSLARYSAESVH